MKNKLDKTIRNQTIIQSYHQGISVANLVEIHQLTKQTIYNIIKNAEIPTHSQADTLMLHTRNVQIKKEFEKGISMPELAKKYNMTRQGIQLILKNQGITRIQGGAAIRAKLKKEKEILKREKQKERNCMSKWGCTLEQWEMLRKHHENFHKTPIARFIQHRSNVLRDAIPWKLTLWQWWTTWQESGRYNERGRGKDAYCMARKKDTGIYELNNIHITTISENLKNRFEHRTSKRKHILLQQGRIHHGDVIS